MKILLFAFVILIFTACGSISSETEEVPVAAPLVNMAIMPLSVEGTANNLEQATWQSIYETPRGGYTLVPQTFGATGVDVNSSFVLSGGATTPVIVIDGLPVPQVSRQADGTFLVTPLNPLSHNSLYTFRLGENSWVFQTTTRFQIVSSLPAHESVNVPVNTGIELTFSSAGHTDLREYFSISPAVEGRFIKRGLPQFLCQQTLCKRDNYTPLP